MNSLSSLLSNVDTLVTVILQQEVYGITQTVMPLCCTAMQDRKLQTGLDIMYHISHNNPCIYGHV